jgi:hypothetical protein
VADARILAAYQVLADTKVPITPAKLATRGHRIPHRLAMAQDPSPRITGLQARRASVAPVAVAPAPPVVAPEPKPAPETVVQKQSDPAQKKRTTVKATAKNLLPKPLRNPKTHPELLTDDAHTKTALKPSDPAQGDHAPPRR